MSKVAKIEQADRWFRGEDKELTFDVVDSAEAVVDIAGWDIDSMLEELHDGSTDDFSKTKTAAQITVGDSVPASGANDRATVKIESTDTEALEPRVYRQSLWRTDGGVPQLLASGAATLREGPILDTGS